MKHYGDITKLHGQDLPVVDVITGGSPCQDLSVAGKRAGLDGERSGLFMDQIRIIKELRASDRANGRTGQSVRPRYHIWENVPGALSSNGGADFQAVLTEFARVADEKIPDVPLPDKGKWSNYGGFYGVGPDGTPFSVAWRIHDAQFWGVPQRRRRVCVLADYGGYTAGEILFDAQLGRKAEGTESDEAVPDIRERCQQQVYAQCQGLSGHTEPGGTARKGTAERTERSVNGTGYGIGSYNSEGMKSDNPHSGIYKTDTSRTLDLNGGSPACNQGGVAVVASVDCRNGTENQWTNGTLQSKEQGYNTNSNNIVRVGHGQ